MMSGRRGLGTSNSVDSFSPRGPRHSTTDRRSGGSRSGSPQDRKALSYSQNNKRSPRRSKHDLLHPVDSQENIHQSLYEDAQARSQRLEMMRHQRLEETELKLQQELEQKEERMKSWSRLYQFKDHRSHLEREQDTLRRKAEKIAKLEAELKAKEEEKFRECTFQPSFKKTLATLHPGRTKSPPPSVRASASSRDLTAGGGGDPETRLRRLVERQHSAAMQLQALAHEEERLRQHLHTVHAELHERIQREETQRVVLMLQDADAEGSTQRDLIHRVRQMVQSGDDPEVAQRQIVEELVTSSQDEVRRRVQEAYGPVRLELEGELYQKRLALVHELEALEAQVIALRGGTLLDEARTLGFEFGLAEKSRRSLSFMTPGSTQRLPTPPIIEETPLTGQISASGRQRISSFGSEASLNAAQQAQSGHTRQISERESQRSAIAVAPNKPMSRSQTPSQTGLSRQSSSGAWGGIGVQEHAGSGQPLDVQHIVREEVERISEVVQGSSHASPRERAVAAAAAAAAFATSSSSEAMHSAGRTGVEQQAAAAAEAHSTFTSSVEKLHASISGQASTPTSPLSPHRAVAQTSSSFTQGTLSRSPTGGSTSQHYANTGGVFQVQTVRSVASEDGSTTSQNVFQVRTMGSLPMTSSIQSGPPPPVGSIPIRSGAATPQMVEAPADSMRLRSGTMTPTQPGVTTTFTTDSMRLRSGTGTPGVATPGVVTPGAVTPPAPAVVSARTLPSSAAAQFLQGATAAPKDDASPRMVSSRTDGGTWRTQAPAQIITQAGSQSRVATQVQPAVSLNSATAAQLMRPQSGAFPAPMTMTPGATAPMTTTRSVAGMPQLQQAVSCSFSAAAQQPVGTYPQMTTTYRRAA